MHCTNWYGKKCNLDRCQVYTIEHRELMQIQIIIKSSGSSVDRVYVIEAPRIVFKVHGMRFLLKLDIKKIVANVIFTISIDRMLI